LDERGCPCNVPSDKSPIVHLIDTSAPGRRAAGREDANMEENRAVRRTRDD
jgi:hypothetical protein